MTQTTKTTIKDVLFWSAITAGIVLTVFIFDKNQKKNVQEEKSWMEVACPSMFSISRSSRDTLIIMKNIPLCNKYIIDNLK